jgi:hypothetical protein
LLLFQYDELCTNIWKCFATDDDDEYDEDQHNLVDQIQQLRQKYDQIRRENERQHEINSSLNEQLKNSLTKFIDILVSVKNKTKTGKNEYFSRAMQCMNKQPRRFFYVLDNK